MEETEEIEFDSRKGFSNRRRLPFINVGVSANYIYFSSAVVKHLGILNGDSINISQNDKTKNVYMYKFEVGFEVKRIKYYYKCFSRVFISKIVELFSLQQEKSYRLYVDITGENIIVNMKNGKQKVVQAYRLLNVTELNELKN